MRQMNDETWAQWMGVADVLPIERHLHHQDSSRNSRTHQQIIPNEVMVQDQLASLRREPINRSAQTRVRVMGGFHCHGQVDKLAIIWEF